MAWEFAKEYASRGLSVLLIGFEQKLERSSLRNLYHDSHHSSPVILLPPSKSPTRHPHPCRAPCAHLSTDPLTHTCIYIHTFRTNECNCTLQEQTISIAHEAAWGNRECLLVTERSKSYPIEARAVCPESRGGPCSTSVLSAQAEASGSRRSQRPGLYVSLNFLPLLHNFLNL